MDTQIEGKIIINNKECILNNRPLDKLIQDKIDATQVYNPFEVSKDKEYNATWLVQDNLLYLKAIEFSESFKYTKEVSSYFR